MKAKPPTKQLRRAAADLRRAHEPRYLSSDRELQRISPAAEQKTTDDVRRSELATKQAARSQIAAKTADLANRVQDLRDVMHAGTATNRGERNLARRIAHDLHLLTDMLKSPSDPGVH
jgi:hypothetical protein